MYFSLHLVVPKQYLFMECLLNISNTLPSVLWKLSSQFHSNHRGIYVFSVFYDQGSLDTHSPLTLEKMLEDHVRRLGRLSDPCVLN